MRAASLQVVGSTCLLLVAAVTTTFVLMRSSSDSSMDKTFPDSHLGQSGEPITFDEFISREFSARYFNGSWWSNSEIVWQDQEGNLILWNIETDTTSILVSNELLGDLGNAEFMGLGPNKAEPVQLFASNIQNVWRHSFLAEYTVFKSDSETTISIVPPGMEPGTKLQYAGWLPNENQNRLIFVHANNIYVQTDVDEPASIVQITSDGIVDEIYNGIPDWVYEEEVLSTNKAFYLPKSGRRLAFARFDDTQVETFHYMMYGNPKEPEKHQYPRNVMIKYPKVGTTNPTIQLKVQDMVDLSSPPRDVLPPPEVIDYGEYLYTAVEWSDDDTLFVIWMNRVQSKSIVSKCSEIASVWNCFALYELSEPTGWLDLFQPPVIKSDGKELLQIQSVMVNGRHYRHLVKVSDEGTSFEVITKGDFVVTEILHWDELSGLIYFVGTMPNDPSKRQLYEVLDSPGSPLNCITCNLPMDISNEPCEYSSIKFSPDQLHYVHSCYGPDVPEIVLRQTDNNAVRHVIEDNADIREKLIPKALPTKVYINIDDDDDGYTKRVRLLLPPDYDESKKYPTLVEVYAGPDSQEVTRGWKVGWPEYLVTNYDVVYVSIDGRGSGPDSNELLFEVNRRLGSVEMEDQINVMKKLQQQYQFIDPERVGIWGWSYGGYATLMILSKDYEDVYACGISVAPPTTWLYYDTIYTERYMGLPTPEDNSEGYKNGTILSRIEMLRGKTFLLNHGNADDNVHYQNSMMLIKALELSDIPFEQQSFPDENHGLYSVKPFLYRSFDRFWSRCFGYTIVDETV